MIDYFIDHNVEDDSGNDGLSALSAFSGIFGKVTDSEDEKKIWVRRGTYSIDSSVSFSTGANTITISWPKDGDDYYIERPQEGIDAGWDDDSDDSALVDFISSSALIIPSQTEVNGISFNGYDIYVQTTIPIFSRINESMTLVRCNINCAYLFYYTVNNQTTDLRNISFISCTIYAHVRMYSFTGTNYYVYLPIHEKCSLYFSGDYNYVILYSRAYTPQYHFEIFFDDCDIYIDKDIESLFYTNSPNSTTDTWTGMASSTFIVRIHLNAVLSYVFHYMYGLRYSKIEIDMLNSPGSIIDIYHQEYTGSATGLIEGSSIIIKNGNFRNILNNNYYTRDSFIYVENCYLTGSGFHSSQEEMLNCSVVFRKTKIPYVLSLTSMLLEDCNIYGITDYIIKSLSGTCNIIGSSLMNALPTTAMINCTNGGRVNIMDSSINKMVRLHTSHTNEKILCVNNNDKTLLKRISSILYSISTLRRKNSPSNRSLVTKSTNGYGKIGTMNIGNGFSSPIECVIDNTVTQVTMYILTDSIEFVTENINIIPRYEIGTDATYTIEEDTSEWSDVGPNNLVRAKIVFDVSPSAQTRFRISMLLQMESGNILYIDPILETS